MMEDNNPFRPTWVNDEELDLKGPEPRSHWFIRAMIMFIGSMMVGMSLALGWFVPNWFVNLLGIAMLVVGAILIRAGVIDRAPSLTFLRPAVRSRPRIRF